MSRLLLLLWFVPLCDSVRDTDFMEYIHVNTQMQEELARVQAQLQVKYKTHSYWNSKYRVVVVSSSVIHRASIDAACIVIM